MTPMGAADTGLRDSFRGTVIPCYSYEGPWRENNGETAPLQG